MSRKHPTTSPVDHDSAPSMQPVPGPAQSPEQHLAQEMVRGAATGAARAVVEWLLTRLSDHLG
ncbi:hypothetical protein [Streptomyces sp. NPDC056817]|uniref:hypothetical protein n=1 Tax=Streptomyces sp. NPDC056817 TaxID=3345950 RepID=UPI00368A6560